MQKICILTEIYKIIIKIDAKILDIQRFVDILTSKVLLIHIIICICLFFVDLVITFYIIE